MGSAQENVKCPNCGNIEAVKIVDTTDLEIMEWCEQCGWCCYQKGIRENNDIKRTLKLEFVDMEKMIDTINEHFCCFSPNDVEWSTLWNFWR